MPNNDPQSVWQDQPKDTTPMTLDQIHHKASELHAKTRRELLASIVIAAGVAVLSWYGISLTNSPGLYLAFAVPIAWAIAGHPFLHRGMWPPVLPGDAAATTGLASYRREVKRRHDIFYRVLRWSLGPIILAILIFIWELADKLRIAGRSLLNMAPFCALFIVWLIAIAIQRSKTRKDLQRELADLNSLEK